jgi:hypothetical protein
MAGDMKMVFGYMRAMDPGSVVRESEYATAANAGGVPEQMRRLWNDALAAKENGLQTSILSPKQRDWFLSSSKNLLSSASEQFGNVRNQWSRQAEALGYSPGLAYDPATPVWDKLSKIQVGQPGPVKDQDSGGGLFLKYGKIADELIRSQRNARP